MKPLNLVLAQADAQNAVLLAENLQSHFKGVSLARAQLHERSGVRRRLDEIGCRDELELRDAREMRQDRLGVASRRGDARSDRRRAHVDLADERLWSAALGAGAIDCCHPSDVRGIVLAANRTAIMARTTAA